MTDSFKIECGYKPGIVGASTAMSAAYCAEKYDFSAKFESIVASGLAEFVLRLENPCNEVWSVTDGNRIVGTVAIDGESIGNGVAHLRWFILADGLRGKGIGRRLIGEAIAFCDQFGFKEVHLWTLAGLDVARHLYEAFGFEIEEESLGETWGPKAIEQKFVRRLAPY